MDPLQLGEARRRGLVGELSLDVVEETSAGGALVRGEGAAREALVIRVRSRGEGYELPKGHVEPGEGSEQAAVREFVEETGIAGPVEARGEIGEVAYAFPREGVVVRKAVRYYRLALAGGGEAPARPPPGTREMRWVRREELGGLPLVSEALRGVIERALQEG